MMISITKKRGESGPDEKHSEQPQVKQSGLSPCYAGRESGF